MYRTIDEINEARPQTEEKKSTLMVVGVPAEHQDKYSPRGVNTSCINILEAINTLEEVMPNAVLVMFQSGVYMSVSFKRLLETTNELAIPCVLYSAEADPEARQTAIDLKFDDYYYGEITESLLKKFWIIRKTKEFKRKKEQLALTPVPRVKKAEQMIRRGFDIAVSASALLVLSPLLLLTALIIKLESRGPVFYISKRAGGNYSVFDFYKFRSMEQGADSKLSALSKDNQYGSGAFVKIKNDPRVTRFGKFIRKTSIDEIPQLINVLKGDMSLVGNRPLPLYEAEQLTKDQAAERFLAPAGVTGLWQVTKRGKDEMSEDERISLDVEYAQKNSFLYDLRLLINTVPALLQKEAV